MTTTVYTPQGIARATSFFEPRKASIAARLIAVNPHTAFLGVEERGTKQRILFRPKSEAGMKRVVQAEIDARTKRAKAEAPTWKVTKTEFLYGGSDDTTGEYDDHSNDTWLVEITTANGTYEIAEGCYCTCPDAQFRVGKAEIPCKHQIALDAGLLEFTRDNTTQTYCEYEPDYSYCGEDY